MTHEELLALLTPTLTESPWERIKEPNSVMKALRAVVELHKPHNITLPDGYYGTDCSVCHGYQYPCPTIQKIIENLE